MSQDSLQEYRNKRRFDETPEPGADTDKSRPENKPIFVVQKHAASRLHYDFRLEVDGVLKSWAVPKGLSTDPSDKRLAVPTEDHPMSYADFEGVIPEGNYGAGTVLVWDYGTYTNITEKDGQTVSPQEALEKGHFSFCLDGKKLKGGFALIKMRRAKEEAWLLVKMDDDYADANRDLLKNEPNSALSGRSIEDVTEAGR